MKIIQTYVSFILLFLSGLTSAQNDSNKPFIPSGIEKIVVLQPTGEIINDLPEMVLIADTSQLYKKVNEIVDKSFINDAIELYFLAVTYLYNKNERTTIEPTYLALSEDDGGYAKVGFCMKTKSGHVEKANTPYIDIVVGRLNDNYNRLMSVTQLYPHEMGHLIYGMLNHDRGNYLSRSVDMHYFSVKTDYSTAFNEGFAEHIENVSRIFEKNDSIKLGVFEDIERIKIKSAFAINGFEKDYNYPFRLGYFKMSMPFWYQKYENLKRYEHAISGQAKYLNSTLELNNIENQLTIRNAGIRPNKNQLRNYVQMLSTEGVISSFFTQLSKSELADNYLDASFYQPFLMDTILVNKFPREIFTPTQNQFLKYFVVFNEYMNDENSNESEFVDFIEGYIRAFPSEEQAVKKLFKEVTHLEYTNNLPTQIWLLVKNYKHRLLVPDPYGAITVPIYTFELNAAETEDFLTIKGLQKKDALLIIEYRKANGFFKNLNQIKEVQGLSKQSVEMILNSEFDEKYVEELSMPELNFMSLLIAPLKHLILYLLAYFIVIISLLYFFFLRKKKRTRKRTLFLFISYLLQWIVFVLGGLFFVVLSGQPWQFLILLCVFFLLINLLIFRKNKDKRNCSFFATCLMGIFILFSVV